MILFNWGSNPGPSACKADVIAITLLNQLMLFEGGRLQEGGDFWTTDFKMIAWFNWGSNPGPSACEADVIASTLLSQLILFQGEWAPIQGDM